FLLLACETVLPTVGRMPVTTQTRDMAKILRKTSLRRPPGGPGSAKRACFIPVGGCAGKVRVGQAWGWAGGSPGVPRPGPWSGELLPVAQQPAVGVERLDRADADARDVGVARVEQEVFL